MWLSLEEEPPVKSSRAEAAAHSLPAASWHTVGQNYPTKPLKDSWHSDTPLLLLLGRFSCVWLCVTSRTVARQAPLSMGFSRQEYWSGLPCPPPGDLPNPGIEPKSPALQVGSLPLSHQGSPEYTEELYKKELHDPDNHDGVITHLEPDILECEGLRKHHYEQS